MAVVREVSKRLVDLGRNDAAAEILRAADQPEEAVSVAIAGAAWDKARESAGGRASLVAKAWWGEGMRLCGFVLGLLISSFGWLSRSGHARWSSGQAVFFILWR